MTTGLPFVCSLHADASVPDVECIACATLTHISSLWRANAITLDMGRVRTRLASFDGDPAGKITALLADIVCDYQCGNGRRPDGSFGWVCGCGNADAVAQIGELVGTPDSE